jgi:signal transduction histidine kinase
MKKAAKKNNQPKQNQNGQTRELVIANRMSGSMHGGLSRIRLSLTFRIAWHYCIQLFRSIFPVAVVFSIIFCIAVAVPVSEKLNKLTHCEDNTMTLPYSDDYLVVEHAGQIAETDFFPRMVQQLKLVTYQLFSQEKISFYYVSAEQEWLVCLNVHDHIRTWIILLAGIIVCDLLRIIYFFRHNQRLNKRVLAPIRDIAAMAEALSESNLSNRINIAGTKNELKDLAVVINRMLDRIERSYNSQKQFVSDASHELRTPIAVIRGYTDMLKRWGKDDPEILDEGITAISQETEGMKDLVESLLFLARHDKKTLMMEISLFNPCDLIQEVVKEEKMVHENYSFITQQMDEMMINADRNMIKQVLRILCDNAVKYSAEKTTVTLSCIRQQNGLCCLSVQDQGQGISQEDLPKIFDRFYRSDKARKSETGGHGLGLSIARIIVVAHDGKIKVRSKPGDGTVFSVLLPVEEKEKIS